MKKLNYKRSPTTEAKLIVIKYFVTSNHIAVTLKSKLKNSKQSFQVTLLHYLLEHILIL